MNGVHDMGGMHGMGPIAREEDEPTFHAPWEARVLALNLAMAAWGKWNIDAGRHQIELIPGDQYLRMSYYEKWLTRLIELIARAGLATPAEIETGHPVPGSGKASPLSAESLAALLAKGSPATRDVTVAARFEAGDRVRAKNINPVGHTRLPRYARGKLGTVERDHGVHVFPDTRAHLLGDNPQHLYSVRFAARELWGDQASPHDSVYLDLWDDHLEPV